MRGLLPAACVFAVLMTTGSSLALVEAIGEVASFAQESANTALNFGEQAAADVSSKAQPVASGADATLAVGSAVADSTQAAAAHPENVSAAVNVMVANVIFMKNSGEAIALGTANALASESGSVPQDPTSTWILVRDVADTKWGAVLSTADAGMGVASNAYAAAGQLTALEQGAIAGLPEAAQACARDPRPLACAEDFLHSIVEA
jgi:hypothetical protein